jgi:hypothetical protein
MKYLLTRLRLVAYQAPAFAAPADLGSYGSIQSGFTAAYRTQTHRPLAASPQKRSSRLIHGGIAGRAICAANGGR